VTWWAKFNKNFSSEKYMISTMDGKKGSKSSFPNKKSKHPMDFKHNKCDPFVGYEQLN
jgi:hypothetical protein